MVYNLCIYIQGMNCFTISDEQYSLYSPITVLVWGLHLLRTLCFAHLLPTGTRNGYLDTLHSKHTAL